MATKLSASAITALKPKATRYEISDTEPGLSIAVMPTGAKSFVVRYRLDGRWGKLTVGNAASMTLAEARGEAREAMRLVRSNIDPARQKQADKAARIAAAEAARNAPDNLVANAVEEFLKRHVKALKSAHEVERLFRKEVIPVWGKHRIEAITKRDVIKLIDAIGERGAPTTAKRTFANVRKFFNWAKGRDFAGFDRSPCEGIGMPSAEVKRDRVLSDEELRLVLLASHKLVTPWAQFVRLLVYTAARRSEVAGATWSEFGGLERPTGANIGAPAFWEIPGARTKNGRIHILPLPEGATEMLLQMPRIGEKGLAFTVTGKTPIVGFSDAKEHLDAAMLAIAREEATAGGGDADKVTIAPWRWHDIRRTVATGMAAKKIAPHVIEAVLNHASGVLSGVAGVYNRHAYADEKTTALGVWAEHVESLEAGTKATPDETNVVRLHA